MIQCRKAAWGGEQASCFPPFVADTGVALQDSGTSLKQTKQAMLSPIFCYVKEFKLTGQHFQSGCMPGTLAT